MWFQRGFHFCGAHLEDIEQIPVTAFEIVKYIAQLLCGGFRIEPKHPVVDIAGSYLIGGVEAAGFGGRFEWSDDDPCRVRAQIQALAIYESELRQGGSLALFEVGSCDLRRRLRTWPRVSFGPSQSYA